jgi:hypothetical protein
VPHVPIIVMQIMKSMNSIPNGKDIKFKNKIFSKFLFEDFFDVIVEIRN